MATNGTNGESDSTGSDGALIRLIAADAGSPAAREAISRLFRRYQERVYQWCFRYSGDHDTAMDLCQEVFLGAYRNIGSFGGRACFSSWLYAIARNRCVSAMRRRDPLEHGSVDPDLLKDDRPGPDEPIEARQEQEAILALMRETLEPIEQEALCLQYFERLPVDSITEVLGITASTGARGVLQSARRKLRAAMARRRAEQGERYHE